LKLLSIRQNYNWFAPFRKVRWDGIFYKNGAGDLVLMSIEAFTLRKKEDRLASRMGDDLRRRWTAI
jgi:hypothetical protein